MIVFYDHDGWTAREISQGEVNRLIELAAWAEDFFNETQEGTWGLEAAEVLRRLTNTKHGEEPHVDL